MRRRWTCLLSLVSFAAAGFTYDYAIRTPGTDIWAYQGASGTQVPSVSTTPSTELTAPQYAQIQADDQVFYSPSTTTNNHYVQMRFVIRIDEPEASVTQLSATWNGLGINTNPGKTDGASLYIWNYATASYALLQASPDTDSEVTLGGSVGSNVTEYIGGAAENEVILFVVSNDKKAGRGSSTLSTDYVSLEVAGGGTASHFSIAHDGYGVHCLAEAVTVTAKDTLGDPILSYAELITLDTQTGKGTWTLLSGDGTLVDATANDGVATYQFVASDNGDAVFGLTYTEGATPLNVSVVQASGPSIADDDTEGLLAFSPTGFTVTASPLSNPPPGPINDPIATQTAGTSFPLYLTAYGTTPTDPTCGVIESYTGAKTLHFWSSYDDPASGTLAVSIDGGAIGASEAAATPRGVTFVAGQAQVTGKYKDVGRIQIAMKEASVVEPAGGIRGGSNPFVVQPATFVITAIERPDLTPNPGESTPTGVIFVAAGTPFRLTVEVRDAEGSLTPNYGNESAPEGLVLRASTLIAPVGGRNGSNDDGAVLNGTTFAAAAPPGTFAGTSFAWDEVGAVRLQASVADGSYLGTGDVLGAESGTVGRFTPADFAVLPNAPAFDPGCLAGGFTYLGQPFGYAAGGAPVLQVTARAAAGTPTRNYTGAWWRLTNASLTGRSYTAAMGALDTTGLPATPVDPAIVDAGDGTGTLTFSSGTGLRFQRTLLAPFAAQIDLSISVIDLDGVAFAANPALFADIAFTGAADSMRFGRLVVGNAHGSELLALDVPFRTEQWNGAQFVVHADDLCTSIPAGELALTKSPAALPTSPSVGNDPFAAGDGALALSAPGAGNTGFADIDVDLSAGGESWLRYDWPHDGNLDGSFDDDPRGRATFGIFAGSAPVVFTRERY